MHYFELMALLTPILWLAGIVLFFILFIRISKASRERNEVLKSILAELKSRKE
ncbi:hypothetical protein SAMN04488101_105100 [Pedobacter nyackensis]|uniref:Uncharacterized protein n=1 Tax=Pedobacter nyackensis TaxID=475255 RepID=A0A1W2CYE9_9SPHI|nr:hypothetical protein SAMN04488101_105100 [Pedobacter nyackensis]